MALTESIEYDKMEIINNTSIQVRKRLVIKKDGNVISSSFSRYVLEPGTLDESDNLVDNPLNKEIDGVTAIPDIVKDICNLVWTTEVKNAYKAILIANKNNLPS